MVDVCTFMAVLLHTDQGAGLALEISPLLGDPTGHDLSADVGLELGGRFVGDRHGAVH